MAGFFLQCIPDKISNAEFEWGKIKPNETFEYVLDLWKQNATFGHISLQTVSKENLTLELQCSNCWKVDVLKDEYPDGIWFNIPDKEEILTASDTCKTIQMTSTPTLQTLKLPPCRYVKFKIKNEDNVFKHFLIYVVSI